MSDEGRSLKRMIQVSVIFRNHQQCVQEEGHGSDGAANLKGVHKSDVHKRVNAHHICMLGIGFRVYIVRILIE